jgi:replicative DNA helicase
VESVTDLANPEAERNLLAVLSQASVRDPTEALLLLERCRVTPERLYLPAHRAVLDAVAGLVRAGRPADPASLWTALRADKAVEAAGGLHWLTDLCVTIDAWEHALPTYAEEIRRLALRRRLVAIGRDIASKAADIGCEPAKTLDDGLRALAGITVGDDSIRSLTDLVCDVTEDMERNRGPLDRLISTGLADLDNVIIGLQPSVLTLIGAEPGVGKSALFASMVWSAAQAGVRVGLFSLEDDGRWLAWRVLARESVIPQPVLRNAPLSDYQRERLVGACSRIGKHSDNVLIDDRPGLATPEVIHSATDMVVNRGCRAIIVDHLGEVGVDPRAERYDLAVGQMARELRDLAKRHRIPVVAASQLNRRKDRKPGTIPQKSDFRNSGDLEAVARVMLGLAREPDSDELKIGIIKQTNGPAGREITVKLNGLAAMVEDAEGARRKHWSEMDPLEQEAHP